MSKINAKKIWSKALKIIPGGNGLLSKRPERFSKIFGPLTFLKQKESVCGILMELNIKI